METAEVREIADHEVFADDLDRAAHVSELKTQNAVQEIRRAAAPEQVRNPDGTWPEPDCIECGEPIPLARLNHGFVRCVDCASRLERKKRGF